MQFPDFGYRSTSHARLTPDDLPFARPTSASLNAVMICSGVCRLLLILTSSLIAATKAAS